MSAINLTGGPWEVVYVRDSELGELFPSWCNRVPIIATRDTHELWSDPMVQEPKSYVPQAYLDYIICTAEGILPSTLASRYGKINPAPRLRRPYGRNRWLNGRPSVPTLAQSPITMVMLHGIIKNPLGL